MLAEQYMQMLEKQNPIVPKAGTISELTGMVVGAGISLGPIGVSPIWLVLFLVILVSIIAAIALIYRHPILGYGDLRGDAEHHPGHCGPSSSDATGDRGDRLYCIGRFGCVGPSLAGLFFTARPAFGPTAPQRL